MHIVVTGGTGFIGRALCASLFRDGHRVSILTRNAREASQLLGAIVTAVEWHGREAGAWEQSLEGADAVINLAGAPIADARWTDARKRLLTDSRVLTTRLLVAAMSRRSSRPRTLISASGIGYYGASDDRVLDEGTTRGQGFLADLCLAWEAEALRAAEAGARVVLLRTGMVLEQHGGALPKILVPFRLFAGGPIMPALVGLLIPGHNRVNRPLPPNLPCSLALQVVLGELGTLMTTGQRVNPAKARSGGYVFHYPTLEPALRAILTKGERSV